MYGWRSPKITVETMGKTNTGERETKTTIDWAESMRRIGGTGI
jgi:hypothetical protein